MRRSGKKGTAAFESFISSPFRSFLPPLFSFSHSSSLLSSKKKYESTKQRRRARQVRGLSEERRLPRHLSPRPRVAEARLPDPGLLGGRLRLVSGRFSFFEVFFFAFFSFFFSHFSHASLALPFLVFYSPLSLFAFEGSSITGFEGGKKRSLYPFKNNSKKNRI